MSQEGWSCPKCSRVWAPHVAACGPCNQGIASFGPTLVPRSPTVAPVRYDQLAPEWRSRWSFTAEDMSYRHQDGDTA